MDTSQTMVRLSSGNHWADLLFRKSVDTNLRKPQESGLALNWVKVDLTLF